AQHAGGVMHAWFQRGHHAIKAGLQLDYLDGHTDFRAFTRDDASPAGGPDPAATAGGSDHTRALLFGFYVQGRWEHGRLTLHGGLRFDEQHVAPNSGGASDQAGVSPRLGLSFAFRPEVMGRVFVGINWQPPAPLDAASAARTLGVIPAGSDVPY